MTTHGPNGPPVPRQQEFPSHYPYHDDEISLVDLARILIKRWKVMAMVFFVVVLVALAYALTMTRSYEYVSLYQVAEQASSDDGSVGTLESPVSIVAKITNLYLGPVDRELRETKGLERMPFEVTASNPSDTRIVRLSSEAAEQDAELVSEMHNALLERVLADQQALLERRRESLERQLTSIERALEAARENNSPYSSELIASYINRVAALQERLAQLHEGQVAQTAVQSLQPTGTGRSLIMALALVLGGMLALMSAFLAQFAAAVRASFDDDPV